MTEQQDAYAKTDHFPPYMARALRYALENSDRESLRELAAEIAAYPVPDGAPVLSHALGALSADGSVTTYTGRHLKDPDPSDPGFCRCGLGLEAWVHTDTSRYHEVPLSSIRGWDRARAEREAKQ
jgi:hypothetical protein